MNREQMEAEAIAMIEARHGLACRENSDSDRQFYVGAHYGFELAIAIQAGDQSRIDALRKANAEAGI